MPESARLYRLVHYAAGGRVLTRTLQLAWPWHWRYGRDPIAECDRARAANVTLDQRATAIVVEINDEIAGASIRPGGRLHLLGAADLLGASDRDLIRRDLLTVQVAVAVLSALAAQATAEDYRRPRP